MKVVLSSIYRGHIYALARELLKLGDLSGLFCSYPSEVMLRRENIPRNKCYSFPWIHMPYMMARRLGLNNEKILQTWLRFDAVHYAKYVAENLVDTEIFHGNSGYSLAPGLLAKRRGAKFICDRSSAHIVMQDRLMREEGDRMGIIIQAIDSHGIETELAEYESCDRVFVPSKFAARTFVEMGVSKEKLWTIPFGVSLGNWRKIDVKADGKFRIIFLGSLSLRKGIHDLIAAFRLAAIPNSELILIGSHVSETQQLLASARTATNITVTGPLSHNSVLEWFSRGSVFVLPSIEDGFGIVLLEAQACGLPVIATTNTGGPDVIENGYNGYIVPIRSPEVIAARLQELYGQPELVRTMSRAALKITGDAEGWSSFARTISSKYRELL